MLGFSVTEGIPGYTGYIPSSSRIGAAPKGIAEHTGRMPPMKYGKKLLLDELNNSNKTLYSSEMGKRENESASSKGSQSVSVSVPSVPAKESVPSPKFVGVSTYKAELLESADTARYFLERRDPFTGRQSTAYQTEYSTMVLPGSRTDMSTLATDTAKQGEPKRQSQLTRHVTPRFEGKSVYSQSIGKHGSNPRTRTTTVNTARDMLKVATTLEFNGGSTKACDHLPGYGGFIPITHPNVSELEKGLPHPSTKHNILLCSLDQYSRTTIPGYGGFRTQGIRNIRERGPPITNTTQGRANYAATRNQAPPVVKTNFRRSTEGVMSFYTRGQVSVSDNGQALSERYFHNIRPLEGLPRIYHPSKTASFGYAFTS